MSYLPRIAGWIVGLVTVSTAWGQDVDILRDPVADRENAILLTEQDSLLLDQIQRGCFNYLWQEVGAPGRLVKDRRHVTVSSIAAVGFQLSALPIGVERGWVSRGQAEQRALTILHTLIDRSDNKRFGVYLHFLNPDDGALRTDAPEVLAGTVDHALLLAGALPAATYFGGEVEQLVERIAADTDWKAFVDSKSRFLSHGWQPTDRTDVRGEGEFRPWTWSRASAEEQLVYFLAVGSPSAKHQVDPSHYYRLERKVGVDDGVSFVMSWNGALFTYFFSHCWIDYGRYTADQPQLFGQQAPRVDWFENSRRATLSHYRQCRKKSGQFMSLQGDRWGLSPCTGFQADGRPTYWVPAVLPNVSGEEQWCEGTVAPYAAASCIIFTPRQSLAALRAFRVLRVAGEPVWQDVADGGFGLADSFSVDQGRVSWDITGIDCGPMLLAIENCRTGLIWNLYHKHPISVAAVERLRWELRPSTQAE